MKNNLNKAVKTRAGLTPKLTPNIHEFTINNRQEGYDILEKNGIHNDNAKSCHYFSMNYSGDNYINSNFNKTNHENVDFIFCVEHYKPFAPNYAAGKLLDYYKNHKGRISDLYIFKKSDEWLKKEQAWLNQQPDIKIHEFTINNREEGYKILEQNGINIDRKNSYDSGSMNESGNNYIFHCFDNTNNENVDFIYCVKRDNPWGLKFLLGDTLDNYKQQKETIKTIYIFKKSKAVNSK